MNDTRQGVDIGLHTCCRLQYEGKRNCHRLDMCLHACGQIQYGLAAQCLIFSFFLFCYFILDSYVYSCARW